MKFTFGWLKEHLDTNASLDQVIETLNKIAIQDKRTKTTLAAKQMDIQAKSIDVKPESDKLIGTREEMFKRLIKDAEVIEEPKNHQKDQ